MDKEKAADLLGHVPDTGTVIEPALVVDSADSVEWASQCDMLVVGYGLAGAAAALKASEAGGLEIVLVDRFGGGGSSALSGGVVYAGGGTRVQKDIGIKDSVDNLEAYMRFEAGAIRKPETIRRFAERSPTVIDWLERHGVVYGGPLEPRKTSYPPPDKFLYYSGNEVAPAYATPGGPAPRGHRAIPRSKADFNRFSGAITMETLMGAIAREPAIRTMFQSAVRRLVVDANGAVIGAEVWQLPPGSAAAARHEKLNRKSQPSSIIGMLLTNKEKLWAKAARIERSEARPVLVRARRGVVLSTGGFGNNHTMMKAFAPDFFGNPNNGQGGDDGSAVRLGASVGARLGQMHLCSPWRFIAPPIAWMKGVMVSGKGERLVNEQLYGANVGTAIMQDAGGKAWLISDAIVQAKAMDELKDKSLWPFQRLPSKFKAMRAKKGRTLEELERKCGFPEGSLVRTIGEYNAALREGRPDAMGKADEQRVRLETGPFYAMDESMDATLNPMTQITLGGIDVIEESGQAQREDGSPIPGLYAAGRSAVGICSHNYVSGLSLADCIFSGWTVADHITGR